MSFYSPKQDVPNSIIRLIQKSFDEPLTANEVGQLQEELRANPQARQLYLQSVQLHLDLGSHSEALRLCSEIIAEFPKSEVEESELQTAISERWGGKIRRSQRGFFGALNYAAAAVLILGMCLGCGIGIVAASAIYERVSFAPFKWPRVGQLNAEARVNATHHCEWQSSDSPETLPTRSVHAGQQIRLEEGLLQLVYRNGLGILLEGPAVYEVRSSNGGKLYTGKLSITAPPLEEAFVLETQQGAMQLRSGQFGIVSEESGSTTYACMVGRAQVDLLPRVFGNPGTSEQLLVGQAVRVEEDGKVTQMLTTELESFVYDIPSANSEPFEGDVIRLGNLFDDSTTTSLTSAMQSDGYQSAGETIDLGVAAVRDGGLDVDFAVVDGGVQFNFANIGGNGHRVRGLPSNDTFRSVSPEPIRTIGQRQPREEVPLAKIEDGVGMSANELITFDLDEIRAAGQIPGLPLRFVSERAGINDLVQDNPNVGSARMVAIVSTENEVLAAYVNGKRMDVEQHAGVYRFKLRDPKDLKWLRRNGRFVGFDFNLPPRAKFLSLATLSGMSPDDDHAVFSGARLEIVRKGTIEGAQVVNASLAGRK